MSDRFRHADRSSSVSHLVRVVLATTAGYGAVVDVSTTGYSA
jgi:hypothetical protein